MRVWIVLLSLCLFLLVSSFVEAKAFSVHEQLRLGDSLRSQWSLASSMPSSTGLLSPLQWRGGVMAPTIPMTGLNGLSSLASSVSQLAWNELPPVVQHQRIAMGVLTGWGIASIGTGIALLFSDNSMFRDFGVQQIAWGAVDLIIAIVALAMQAGKNPAQMELQKQKRDFRFSLWLNTGLDVLYMVAGVLMMTVWGKQLAGHGAGVLVQGGFLFVFDLVNALLTYRY